MSAMPKRLKQTMTHAIAGMLLAFASSGPLQASDYRDSAQVREFIEQMTREHGFADEQLLAVFAQAERKQTILDAISRPAEKVKPWKDYRPIFLTEARTQQGVTFWNKHADALQRASEEYGVAPQVIVAIIGVETFYGGNTGSWRVIDALSTLCFDYPPRAPFFCQQLKEFFLLARQEQVDPLNLKGSYAGAMGLPQFMPSSFRAYAVDFDGDGRIDIWNNPTDAIGSVASYFKHHGWTAGGQVVQRASVTGERFAEGRSSGIEPEKTVAELRELGWIPEQPLPDDLKVTAFQLEGANGMEYWFGLKNFYAITRYNRSAMYAMAVHQLSDALLQARGKP
jgi:membrane-bound lytic murein transglycosylase B